MAFNTQSSQDIDESFHDLSESPSNYSPNLSELDESFEELENGNLKLSPNASDNGLHSPIMSSKRARRNLSQRSRKNEMEEQKRIATDLRAQQKCCNRAGRGNCAWCGKGAHLTTINYKVFIPAARMQSMHG